MIKKRNLEAQIKFTVKLTKDSFDDFQDIKESVYVALEKDIKKALKRIGYTNPKVIIY